MLSITKKAFVLLSGGLDSTTTLFQAIHDYAENNHKDIDARIHHNLANPGDDPISWVEAVSIHYGQRHSKEMQYARTTCERLGINHLTFNIHDLISDENTMLVNESIEVPDVSYADLPAGVSPTYVPFRNGTMLALLTAHAQKWVNARNNKEADWYSEKDASIPRAVERTRETHEAICMEMARKNISAGVYFGAHAEDAHNWAYPDCTPEFIGAMANAIYIGSYQQIRLHAPLMNMQKKDIVELGNKLGVPFENTWSCYKGGQFHCSVCPTCRSRKEAFIAAQIDDPTVYAEVREGSLQYTIPA